MPGKYYTNAKCTSVRLVEPISKRLGQLLPEEI